MKAEKPIFKLREDNLPELPNGWEWRISNGKGLGYIFTAENRTLNVMILITDFGGGKYQQWWASGKGITHRVGPNIKAVLFREIVKLRMGL